MWILFAALQADRWEADIAKFEEQDRKNPPAKGGVVFVGSSSIRMWNIKKYFPDKPYLNRGFGGSTMADALRYADRIVLPHEPKTVVLYEGDNDLAGGVTPEQLLEQVREFTKKVRERLPDTRVIVVSVKPSIARWKLAPQAALANALVRAHCSRDPKLSFFDVWPLMLDDAGRPRADILQKDGLHMTDEGYRLWSEALAPLLN